LVKDFLAKNNVTTLEHHPYSLDVAAADLYLFPRMKSALKGLRLCDKIAKNAFTEWLSGIFLTIFQLYKGTILKEMWRQLLYCFVFLKKKLIPGTFWSYHV
jgi:hypothetical protein